MVRKQVSRVNKRASIKVGDFQSWMKKRGLGITLATLAADVGLGYSLPTPGLPTASNKNVDPSVIRRGAEQLLLHIFGPIDFSIPLHDAAVTFVNTRVSPKIVGDFVSFTIGEMLGKMSSNVTLPSFFGQAQLALRGDCIAGWRFAYTTAAATAASLGMINTSYALLNSEAGLSIAIDGSLKYVLDGLIGGFFSEVFGQSAGQYQGWHLRLRPTDRVIDLVAAAGRTGRIVEILSHRNKLIAVLRDMGASFPDAGGSKTVTLAIISPDGSVERINLDGWSTVSAVHQAGDHFVLSGQRVGGPIRSILAIDLSQTPPKQHLLEGNDLPPSLSVPNKVLESRDRSVLIVGSQLGGASILSVPR